MISFAKHVPSDSVFRPVDFDKSDDKYLDVFTPDIPSSKIPSASSIHDLVSNSFRPCSPQDAYERDHEVARRVGCPLGRHTENGKKIERARELNITSQINNAHGPLMNKALQERLRMKLDARRSKMSGSK
eukprot:CAMPEP_0184342676 /NCGR_PEP_ID=MMETSP1089-20130417/11262_1 /TAXON_ID=38269 ORGANISM="Gloeochaete wittrockiana, Strain SAG46.84" /NCGR_SAMPLE_ID=MMETSP1089 /ASSEMBLY_ACC=CAM_ASM_000445 /LENGTH=129 /DNA_ID=CAMNT_0026671643 /DNA_START=794 /DNA_END=1183 /DNA_ORIENTATION=+